MSVALVLGGGALAPDIARLLADRGFSVALEPAPGEVGALVAKAAHAWGGPVTCCVNGVDMVATEDSCAPQDVAVTVMEAMARQGLKAQQDATGELAAPCIMVNLIDQSRHATGRTPFARKLTEMALQGVTEAGAKSFAPVFRVNAIGIRTAQKKTGRTAQSTAVCDPDPDDLLAALAYILDAPAVTGQVFCIDIL